MDFPSGQPLRLTVDFDVCLSTTCHRAGETSCHVTRSGTRLEVTASGYYTDADAEACSADCQRLTATCETEALPPDNYEIRYAGQTLEVTIPSSKFKFCSAGSRWNQNCCDSDADCPGTSCDSHSCR